MTPFLDAYLIARVAICVPNVIAVEAMTGANDGKVGFVRTDDEGNIKEIICYMSRDPDDGLPMLDDESRDILTKLLDERM